MKYRSKLRQPATDQQGFTLVELSIVLVIIGLIVGGVLVGQDLIKVAQIRSQISQFNQLNVGVTAFRAKYDCIPGDCANAVTLVSGFSGHGTNGDGNGVLNDDTTIVSTFDDTDHFGGEVSQVFPMLGYSGLGPSGAESGTSGTIGTVVPASKLGGVGILPLQTGGQNYWLAGLKGGTTLQGAAYSAGTALTAANTVSDSFSPTQAGQIDAKMDDGSPTTGGIQAFTGTVVSAAGLVNTTYDASAPYSSCANTATVYNVADTPLCTVAARWN